MRRAAALADPPDTRHRIVAAAGDEFGAHGFDATSVDRIARRARVNKAMIYYHFPNKRALYTAIIRDVFTPIAQRVSAAVTSDVTPERKLDAVIETLVRSIDESTYFLPLFLREIADGGAHLGADELALLASVFGSVRALVGEGTRQGVFHPVHPALAHFTIVAPILMFRASAPVRARLRSVRQVDIPDADAHAVVEHMQLVAQRMLAAGAPSRQKGERKR